MRHIDRDGIDVYRIGWWTHHWWPRRRILACLLRGANPDGRRVPRSGYLKLIRHDFKLIRRPHRPWQAEYDDCRWCRRGWTPQGVRRKAERDRAYQQATGLWAPWIQRKVRRRYGPDAIKGPVRTTALRGAR